MCTQRNIYRKVCRLKRRIYNRKEAESLADLSRSNPRVFWDKVKSNKKKQGLPGLDFYEHFKGLADRNSKVSDSGREEINEGNMSVSGEILNDSLDMDFSMDELNKGISKLKGGKSAGPDEILNEFIVNATYEVKLLILSIFNSALRLEYFPSCWSIGSLAPIYKSGDIGDVNNYRGIPILSCLGK